jgi:hypothetical protein
LSLQRCSRPLCSSQNTGGPSPNPVPTATSLPKRRWFNRREGPGRSPARGSSLRPKPSGPNNVSGATTNPSAFHCRSKDRPVLATRDSASAK